MRTMLLTSAALLGLACGLPALAQTSAPDAAAPETSSPAAAAPDAGTATDTPAATGTTPAKPKSHHRTARHAAGSGGETFAHEPGTGQSGPASMTASNITQSNTRSDIAPHLPQPAGGLNAGPRNYLRDADRALATHKTGLAQQALEMAETRLLDRATEVDAAGHPSTDPMIQQVSQARRELAAGNVAGARSAIRMALASAPQGGMESGMPAGTGMSSPGMSPAGMARSEPGGAPMGNGTPTSATMSPSGAGPVPGNTAGARVGGGAAGTGTADSAGGAK